MHKVLIVYLSAVNLVNQLIFSTICTLVVKPAQHCFFLFTKSAAQDGVPRLEVRARRHLQVKGRPRKLSFSALKIRSFKANFWLLDLESSYFLSYLGHSSAYGRLFRPTMFLKTERENPTAFLCFNNVLTRKNFILGGLRGGLHYGP